MSGTRLDEEYEVAFLFLQL
nr:unnamed protein product [Callosobruchus chinensis]